MPTAFCQLSTLTLRSVCENFRSCQTGKKMPVNVKVCGEAGLRCSRCELWLKYLKGATNRCVSSAVRVTMRFARRTRGACRRGSSPADTRRIDCECFLSGSLIFCSSAWTYETVYGTRYANAFVSLPSEEARRSVEACLKAGMRRFISRSSRSLPRATIIQGTWHKTVSVSTESDSASLWILEKFLSEFQIGGKINTYR